MKLNLEILKTTAKDRLLFIWGSRIFGIAAAKRLQTMGLKIAGFIDSVKRTNSINGLPVLSSTEFFSRYTPHDSFVLVSTQGYFDAIKPLLLEHNFSKNDFFDYNDFMHLHYYIETNNRCNLRCKTCSVSSMCNSTFHNMEKEMFEHVIDKIVTDDPFAPCVCLYSGNEPLLSKDLPEKIAYCKQRGLGVGLSTNLTPNADYERFVKSQPDWVRISMSGWGEHYEQMHRGGKFAILLKHMRLLSSLRAQYAPEMSVDVIFHKYNHNAEDIPRVKALCEELGFQFSTMYAALVCLDVISAYLEKRPIPRAMRESLPLLCHSLEETAQKAYESRHLPCRYENVLHISSDGSMGACQLWMGSYMEDAHFLTTPLENIEQALRHSPLCPQCKPKGLHTFGAHLFDGTINDD